MEHFTYYRNKFTPLIVGMYGGEMTPGTVYAPAVNMPQDPVEHYVPIPGGVDEEDGIMFYPEHWSRIHSSLHSPAH